ncbi:MAG: hypothetical protein HN368_03505 [Spirochaetales bacterium]|nr:hypothetical protein [Spirochaetales bacterium]
MKKFLAVTVFLMFIMILPAVAKDYTVDYLDGYLDIKDGGEWYELIIGEVVTENDTIRLDEDSVVELAAQGTKLTLTKPGVYVIADLLKASGESRSVGLASVIGSKIKSILEEPKQTQTAVMGVRGAKSDDELEWMSGDTAELLKSGKEFLSEGEYADAVGVLEEAYDFADEAEEGEVLFFLSFANALMGELRVAIESLNYVEPDPESEFFTDLILLKGQLLTETFAYQEAAEWLSQYESDLAGDDAATQMSLLLQGISHKGLGNINDAKQSLQKAVNLGSSSEAGVAAQDILNNL